MSTTTCPDGPPTTGPRADRPTDLDLGRPRAQQRHGAPLAVAMLGFFVVALDAQIVNVALPAVGGALGGGLAGLQWVVTAYTLTFSALLLLAGTLSDRLGARAAYGAGMLVFVLASLACGLAPSIGVLIAARVAQGIGAALVTPTSLALIRAAYADPRRRAQAVAYWALGGSVAAAAGPVLGGILTHLDWRLIFLVNLPVGAVALVLLARVAETTRHRRAVDPVGQLTAVVALVGVTYGLIEGGSRGFGSGPVVLALLLAAVAAAGFLLSQARGRHPMVPLDLFASRTLAVGLTTAFVTMAGFYGLIFVESLWFQDHRGASPLQTGLLFLPMTALVAALNPYAARVAVRFGTRVPVVGGQVLMIGGLVALAAVPPSLPLWAVALLMVPVGVGGSFTVPPLTSLIMDAVPGERAGTTSGVLNTARQVGGSIGVAFTGALIAHSAGFTDGLRGGFLVLAALVALTALLCATLLESGREV